MTHRYIFMSRPPLEGMPDGATQKESDYEQKQFLLPDGQYVWAFGFADYPNALPLETVWKYSIVPADGTEYAHYIFYQFANRDIEDQAYYERDYVGAYNGGR